MDENYFEDMRYKIGETVVCFDPVPANRRLIKILKQVAHDARAEQAKVDREAVEKCGDGRDGDGDACILNAIAALADVAPKDKR